MQLLPPISPRHRLLAATGVAALLVLGLVAARIATGAEHRGGDAIAAPLPVRHSALPPVAPEIVPPEEPVTIAAPLADEVQGAGSLPAPADEPEVQAPALPPPAPSAAPVAGQALAHAAPVKPEPLERTRLPDANERLARETRAERVQRMKQGRQTRSGTTPDPIPGTAPERPHKQRR